MWLLFPLPAPVQHLRPHGLRDLLASFMMMLVDGRQPARCRSACRAIASLLFFVPPFHMYRHLKQSLRARRFSAIMRTMALVTFAFIAAALFAADCCRRMGVFD